MNEERLAEIDDDAKSHLTWGDTYGDGICTAEEIRALVAEVRLLRAENADIARTWVPLSMAKTSVEGARAATIEQIAQLVETMTDQHRRSGHATLGYQLNDARRDQYRAIAAYIRMAVRTTRPEEKER